MGRTRGPMGPRLGGLSLLLCPLSPIYTERPPSGLPRPILGGPDHTMKIRLPYPHPGQQAVRSQAKRFNFLAAGRRWRKTTLFMTLAVEAALAGKSVVWGAPTNAQVDIPITEMGKALPPGAVVHHRQKKTMYFPSGGRVYFRSLDNPDSARGLTADLVFVDEAGFVSSVAWYEVLLPMLLDTGGTAWIGGTPNRRNWFYTELTRARSRPDAMAWNIPTLGVEVSEDGTSITRHRHPLENPFITFEDIRALFEGMTLETFRQEILAVFLENSGSVFSFLDRSVNLPMGWAVPEDHEGHQIVAGVDWGKLEDYFAMSIGCVTCKKELELARAVGVEYSIQRERIKKLREYWKSLDLLVIEQNSIGEVQLEELVADNVPCWGFQTTAASKGPIIDALAFNIEKGLWKFLDHPIGSGELLAYERRTNPNTGHTSYSAPEGVHDDTVIARALMLEAAKYAGPLIL